MTAVVEVGDPIRHKATGRHLGVVTAVRRATVRFTGPDHKDGLAGHHEIERGEQ